VVRRGEADGGTVEVAHEALFREWKRLQGWLEPERARLDALRSLQVDAATWDRKKRAGAFLNHRGKRLAEAAALVGIEGYRKRMAAVDLDYLAACQAAERWLRRRLRAVQAVVGVLGLGVVAGMAAWVKHDDLQQGWRYMTVIRPFIQAHIRPLNGDQERALKAAAEACVADADPARCTFRECTAEQGKDYCPEMIVLPAGSFMMGSRLNEGSIYDKPQHPVTITNAFAVAKVESTFDEWNTCVDYGDCAKVPNNDFGEGQQPVINVTWEDAQRYVAWLSKMSGKPYRLLTEAEYEYATRAGTETIYPWGNDQKLNGKVMANCERCGSQWDIKRTAPVGSFYPNKFGLYDMVGNVWEWVEDCNHNTYVLAPRDGSEWRAGCAENITRIVRGGSWGYNDVRSAHRDRIPAGARSPDLGFRVGRTLTP
jgi:formylglycine-generating enzyme required for sulfatase activity